MGGESNESNNNAPPDDWLEITLNDLEANRSQRFASNYIQTAKYTWWSFIPMTLYEQFHRGSNLYFLLSAIVSCIPSVSPISPVTTITPLLFVLAVTALKDGYEDLNRHKADRKANSTPYRVLRGSGVVTVESADIETGDIVFLEKNEGFPADLVTLATSEVGGVCYVETMNLDGENNLKRRVTPKFLTDFGNEAGKDGARERLGGFKGRVLCEPSDIRLYSYVGTIEADYNGKAIQQPLSEDQLLLRGAMLRNTRWVYGLVVYAGEESKMFKNLSLTAGKSSSMQRKLDYIVGAVFILNLIWVVWDGVAAGFFQKNYASDASYLDTIADEDVNTTMITYIGTYFVLYTYLIPISLFVTIELVRVFQAAFMYWDAEMTTDPSDAANTSCVPRNSNMNEELGLIEHIFSDKTGTLTQNIMDLAFWTVGADSYDYATSSDCLSEALAAEDGDDTAPVNHFLRCIALCNTVIPEEKDGELDYEAESPDEVALVKAAHACGCSLLTRVGSQVTVEFNAGVENYEVLATLEFTSDRKRMSVIVRWPDGHISLICKGADSYILDRARSKDPLRDVTIEAVDKAASLGLRTLVVAELELDEDECDSFLQDFNAAVASTTDRKAKVHKVEEKIEQNMKLLGATAVEDKLQVDVANTLDYFLKAGLHIWVLTGDKIDTAIQIGFSTKLLNASMTLLPLYELSEDEIESALDTQLAKAKRSPEPALVVDGPTLYHLLHESNDFRERFVELGELCGSVICCRVTPIQKAQVVELVRTSTGRRSLAIGDGANDVSMIQTAHVGIGVVGKEGTQAVRASDFAIQEFRHLKTLMCVHGRYSVIRLANLIQYSFYKNIMFILPQFLYAFYSGYTGQVLYDEYILAGFNVVWAFLPPFVIGIWEKDISREMIYKFPPVYAELRYRNIMGPLSVAGWTLLAIFQGIVVYFAGMNGALYFGQLWKDGTVGGIWINAMFMSTLGITLVLCKAAFMIQNWSPFSFAAIGISFAAYYLYAIVVGSFGPIYFNSHLYGVMFKLMGSATFWLGTLLILALCFIPDIVVSYVQTTFYPWNYQILREVSKIRDYDYAALNPFEPEADAEKGSSIVSEKMNVNNGSASVSVDSRAVSPNVVTIDNDGGSSSSSSDSSNSYGTATSSSIDSISSSR